MNLRPWIAAILNFSFAGAGYIYAGRKVFGVILLTPTVIYQIWYYVIANRSEFTSSLSLLIGFISLAFAIDVYRQMNRNYAAKKDSKNISNNKISRRIFIGFFVILLLLNLNYLADSILRYFTISTNGLDTNTVINNRATFSVAEFIYENLSSFSLLIIPILSYYLQLVKKPILKITSSFLFLLLLCFGLSIWNTNLIEKNQPKNTREDLLAAFNEERDIHGARPLRVNTSLCKIAELRLDDILTNGKEPTNTSSELGIARDIVTMEEEQKYDATKDHHVTDNVFEIYSDKDVADIVTATTGEIETSYVFTDDRFEYGCVMEKDGLKMIIMGFDDEPYEPKLNDNWSKVSI